MKKILALILMVALCLSMAACTNNGNNTTDNFEVKIPVNDLKLKSGWQTIEFVPSEWFVRGEGSSEFNSEAYTNSRFYLITSEKVTFAVRNVYFFDDGISREYNPAAGEETAFQDTYP